MSASNTGRSLRLAGVLAGGHSIRMGQPKALLRRSDGRTFIEHVASVAAELAGEVVILGRGCELPQQLADCRVLEDSLAGAGPLGGLASLLEAAGDDRALLLACDLARLQRDVIDVLLEHASAEDDAVVFAGPDKPDRYHACCGLYHPRILPEVRRRLEAGPRSMHGLLRAVGTRVLPSNPDLENRLANYNTPQQLQNG